jgi:Transposase and inactivated derivatives, IS30 family
LHCSFRQIAAKLGGAPSTISREVNRNGGAKKYRAADAGEKTWQERFGPSLADSQCSWSIVGDMVTVFALVAHVNRQ